MNKSEVRDAIYDGRVTVGMLRNALAAVVPKTWERSTVNPAFTKLQSIDILRKAVATDTRADAVLVSENSRDVLLATNVLRECGFSAALAGEGEGR